ncbi:MAG: GNAT family N-acetyltransferase [Chloroflexi bacterium]|nr:GNAT family N-acetyltransferase [Chloroflexota bacterium]
MPILEPMTIAQYDQYIQHSLDTFRSELLKTENYTQEEAIESTGKQILDILPAGIATQGHYFFNIKDDKKDLKVGNMWVAYNKSDGGEWNVFIYDIEIDEEYRGQGYGRQAMQALEIDAKEKETSKIFLHVFAHNQIAFNLYQKVGFRVVKNYLDKKGTKIISYRMVKNLN